MESQSQSAKFKYAAADAIVEMLSGKTPRMPADLELSGFLADQAVNYASRDAGSEEWLEQNWGWFALTWWCRNNLTEGQKSIIKGQNDDLDELGLSFWGFLTRDKGEGGVAIRSPASFILAANCPAAVVLEWFYRFLVSPVSPFRKTVIWKLKSRFDAILKGNRAFQYNEIQRTWHLTGATVDQSKLAVVDSDKVATFLLCNVGRIEPFIYKRSEAVNAEPESHPGSASRTDRADPLIRREDALRVAEAAITRYGPMSSHLLAQACRALLPDSIGLDGFCNREELNREPPPKPDSSDESSDGESDAGSDEKWEAAKDFFDQDAETLDNPGAGRQREREENDSQPMSETASESVINPARERELADLVHSTWTLLPPREQIVAAARVFEEPAWKYQCIQDWTERNLASAYQIAYQRAADCAGKDNTRIRNILGKILRPVLQEIHDQQERLLFAHCLREEARKTLKEPPFQWVNVDTKGKETLPSE